MATELPVRLERAKSALVKRLAGEPGFVGAGISRSDAGQYEIVVMVVEQTSPVLAKVPPRGAPVRLRRPFVARLVDRFAGRMGAAIAEEVALRFWDRFRF